MRKKIVVLFYLLLFICTSVFAQCNSWIEESSISLALFPRSITTDISGNAYSTGETLSNSISFGNDTLLNNKGGNSFYINKYDNNGTIQWARQLEASFGMNYPVPVICQKNGSLYVAGIYYDTLIVDTKTGMMLNSLNTTNFFLLKLDLSGNLKWTKSFVARGRPIFNAVWGITINNLNQVYFTGQFSDTVTFGSYVLTTPNDPYPVEAFLAKTDSDGNVMWAIQANSIAYNAYSNGWGITADKNENIIIGGTFLSNITFGSTTFNPSSNSSDHNPFVAKFDSSGNCQWITGGKGIALNSELSALTADSSGSIYFSGVMDTTITFNGNTLSGLNGNIFYGKYNQIGNLVWIKQVGNEKYNALAGSLVIDVSNNLWLTGISYGNANFGNYSISDSGVFIAKFDTGGTMLGLLGSKGINSWGLNLAPSSALDANGNLYVGCRSSSDTISFDGITILGPPSDSVSNQFHLPVDITLKYCTSSTGIPQLSPNNSQLSIYPNPTNGEVNIISSKNIGAIKISNLIGQNVFEKLFSDSSPFTKQTLDLSLLIAGMYIVTVTANNETTTSKIIVTK